MTNAEPSFDKIRELERELSRLNWEYDVRHDLFAWQWWLLLALLIVPWILWWLLIDKTRLKENLLFGGWITLLIVALDDMGRELQLWSYPRHLLRLTRVLFPVDCGFLPVFHMLLYYYFRSWKGFLIANAIAALLFAFVAEPLFVYAGIYEMDNWRHVYSVIPYIGKSVLVRWLIERAHLRARAAER